MKVLYNACCCVGEKYLPAVPRRANPCRAVNTDTDVFFVVDVWFGCVQTDPDSDRCLVFAKR